MPGMPSPNPDSVSADVETDPTPEEFSPTTRESLGRATWTFLHTLAATHPENPSASCALRTSRFMRDFSNLYPCAACAASLREIVARRDPDEPARSGKVAFSRWMCEVHNEVNKELGKEPFDCSEKNLQKRWGECDSCAAHSEDLEEFTLLTGITGMKGPKSSSIPRT